MNSPADASLLRTDEQLVTKAEAYRRVGARLKTINEELGSFVAAGRKGLEKHEAELNAEADRLIDYLDQMEKSPFEEAREAFREGAGLMVENPLYSEKVTELGEEGLEKAREEAHEEAAAEELVYELDAEKKAT